MISVITPVHNKEKYILQCLKNVKAQNCEDMEHIVIDGLSSDRTVEIIKGYAGKNPHLRWVSEPDLGQSDAMNKGIRMARGTVLGILNADDFYEPGVLCRVAKLFESFPEPSFVAANCKVLGESDKLLYINKPKNLRLKDLLQGFKLNPHPINPSAYFYHTSLHQAIGFYEVGDHQSMDLEFIFRAVQRANIHYRDEIWGNYRYIPGTKTFEAMKTGKLKELERALFERYRKNEEL
jgi:glycosyltransferase involved in cell wall biosynthesis